MSKYSDLDAHSRNCPSCIRQREGQHGEGGKKHSLPCHRRKMSTSDNNRTAMRRSTSSLSYADFNLTKEDSFEGSNYLTPTQRKNNEIKRLRAELNKANEIIQAKDKEIIRLRSEMVKYKEGVSPDLCEAASIPDSGTCDWESEQEPENRPTLHNIDFELMETTLKEEEETRQQLLADNDNLTQEVNSLMEEINSLRVEVTEMEAGRREMEVELERVKVEHVAKLGEVVRELSESTVRYSRQQTLVEEKQGKLEEVYSELNSTKTEVSDLRVQLEAVEKSRLADLEEKEAQVSETRQQLENSRELVTHLENSLRSAVAATSPPNRPAPAPSTSSPATPSSLPSPETATLREEIAKSNKFVSRLQDKVQSLETELEKSEAQLHESEARWREREHEVARLERRMAERQAEVDQLLEKMLARESELARLEKQLAAGGGQEAGETLQPPCDTSLSTEEPVSGGGAVVVGEVSTVDATNRMDNSWRVAVTVGDGVGRLPEVDEKSCQYDRVSRCDFEGQVNLWEEELAASREARPAGSIDDYPNHKEAGENNIIFTYQFLKRSIYYFLTDKDNREYHLKSIERLLQFSDGERETIDRHKPHKRY